MTPERLVSLVSMNLNELHHRILYGAHDLPFLYEIPQPVMWPRLPDGSQYEVFPAAPVEAVRHATRELAVEGLVVVSRYTTEGRVELEGEHAVRAIDDPKQWVLETGRVDPVELRITPKGEEIYGATFEQFGGPARNAMWDELYGRDD